MNVEAFNNIVLALFETAVAMSAIIAILLLLTPLLGPCGRAGAGVV